MLAVMEKLEMPISEKQRNYFLKPKNQVVHANCTNGGEFSACSFADYKRSMIL